MTAVKRSIAVQASIVLERQPQQQSNHSKFLCFSRKNPYFPGKQTGVRFRKMRQRSYLYNVWLLGWESFLWKVTSFAACRSFVADLKQTQIEIFPRKLWVAERKWFRSYMTDCEWEEKEEERRTVEKSTN